LSTATNRKLIETLLREVSGKRLDAENNCPGKFSYQKCKPAGEMHPRITQTIADSRGAADVLKARSDPEFTTMNLNKLMNRRSRCRRKWRRPRLSLKKKTVEVTAAGEK